MIQEIIQFAVEYRRNIIFLYSQEEGINNVMYLRSIKYSPYGKKYITGVCDGSKNELTFKIDKIKRAEIMWNEILDENTLPKGNGLYLITCITNNYRDYVILNLQESEKIDNYRINGLSYDTLLAYHIIPPYSVEDTYNWTLFNSEETLFNTGVYIFAYIPLADTPAPSNISVHDDFEKVRDILSENNYRHAELNGTHYFFIEIQRRTSFKELRIAKNIKILGYHRCMKYTYEENLKIHNEMMEKRK